MLTLGVSSDPITAVKRLAGLIEETAQYHGIINPLQTTVAIANGKTLWVFRYSTEHQSRSLYYSMDFRTLRERYPDNERIASVSDDTRLVVSEPLVDLPSVWNEVPESSCVLYKPVRTNYVFFSHSDESANLPNDSTAVKSKSSVS